MMESVVGSCGRTFSKVNSPEDRAVLTEERFASPRSLDRE